MKYIIPAIIATALPLALSAQTTGTIQGKVSDSKGNPIPTAKVVLSKVAVTWVKEIKVGSDGKFLQVGLEPKEYEITVSAPGYVDHKERERITILTMAKKEYVLMTPEEAVKAGKATGTIDPGAAAESAALDSYNQAVAAYKEKNFEVALPLFESSIKGITESIEKTADETVKAETKKKLETMERPYTFCLMEASKLDEARKADFMAKAAPLLGKMYEKNTKDQNAVYFLLEIAKAKNDAAEIQKFQAAYDAIVGPDPNVAYNQGVELYNAGKLSEAKPHLQKALSIKADYAEAYYLLAMCEFADMNLKGTKTNLQKYLELAPTGKYAAEVKAMLADPSLKNVK